MRVQKREVIGLELNVFFFLSLVGSTIFQLVQNTFHYFSLSTKRISTIFSLVQNALADKVVQFVHIGIPINALN
jgi:hypothetical protein